MKMVLEGSTSLSRIGIIGIIVTCSTIFVKSGEGEGVDAWFGEYNATCNPPQSVCSAEANLACVFADGKGLCKCLSGYVYVPQTDTCWLVPKSEQDNCAHDVQCKGGKWGPSSRCNKRTRRCECFDHQTAGKTKLGFVNGKCLMLKQIGDICQSESECFAIRNAFCRLVSIQNSYTNFTCQCEDGYKYYPKWLACLKLSIKFGDKCEAIEQCQEGSLGHLSKCSASGTCECHSPDRSTAYSHTLNKCFHLMYYNDTCNHHEECRASLGPDVVCGVHEAHPVQKVCYCPTGKVCRSTTYLKLKDVPGAFP